MDWKEFKRLPRWFSEAFRANPVVFLIFVLASSGQGPLIAIATVWSGKLVDLIPGFLQDQVTSEQILYASFVILGVGLIVSGVVFVQLMVKGRLQDSLAYRIKRRLLDASIDTEYLTILSSDKQDRLTRILRGFDMDMTFLLMDSVACLGTLWTIISYLSVIGLTSGWFVALTGLMFLIPITVINFKLVRKEIEFDRTASQDDRRVQYAEKLLTSMETAKEVKLFGLGQHLIAKWKTTYTALKRARSRMEMNQHNWKSGTQMLSTLISGGLLLLIVSQNELTPGVFLVVLTALTFIQSGLVDISKSISMMVLRLVRLEEIDAYLKDIRSSRHRRSTKTKVAPIDSTDPIAITFEDVSFSYDNGNTWVLEKINIRIEPGKRIALIGENGAGKSTLVNLILGLYRPTAGRVLVNGFQPADLDSAVRHKMISTVFQTFGRYHGLTLGENVTLSCFEHTENQQLIPVLRRTDLFSAFKDKLDVVVGKEFDGIELSGGEWQRVALARAMLLDTPLVILDEPTASLDPLAEAGLFQSFMDLLHNQTVVVVTHRLGSIKRMDEIIVLKSGRIMERGDHRSLMGRRGHYWDMFEAQAKWYRKQPDEPAVSLR